MAAQAISGEVQALQGLLVRTNENGQCKILKQGSLIHAGDTVVLLGGGHSLIKLLFQPAISLLPDQAYTFQLNGISPLLNKIPETPLEQLLKQTQLGDTDIFKLIEQLEAPAAGEAPLQSGGASFYTDKPLFSLGHVGAGYDTRFAENDARFAIEQNNILGLRNPKPEAMLALNDGELTLDESITLKYGDSNASQGNLSDPFNYGKPLSIAEGDILSSSGSQFNQPASAITTRYALELGDSPSALRASDGSPITLVLENDRVLGKSGNTVVFAIGIDESSGKITVVQYHGLYHNNPDSTDESLSLTNLVKASLTLKDTSGDVSTATIEIGSKIHFEDDAPLIHSIQQTGLVDTTIEHQVMNGTIQVDFGSDLAKDLTFSSDALRILQASQLTSNGEALIYNLSRDSHTITAAVRGTDITVFKLSLSAVIPNAEQTRTPSYQFQLFQALDQPPNKITLVIPIKAIDADNDIAKGNIRISITDGPDAAGGNSSQLISTEGDLDAIQGAYPVTTNHQFSIEAGVDRLLPESLGFADNFINSFIQEFNQEITAGGLALHVTSTVVNGVITLTAVDTNNEVVLQLKLTPVNIGQNIQISAELIQYKPLDHQNNGDSSGIIRQNGSSIDFDLQLQAKDSDGDPLQNPVNLHVQINDANPPALGQDSIAFTEATIQQVVLGQVLLDLGSDKIATLVFEDSNAMHNSLSGLTSGGYQTSYQINNNVLSITINDPLSPSNGQELLNVILNTDGSFTATLKGPFDQINDVSELLLTVRATDKDSDQSNLGEIHLSIHDAPSQSYTTQASTTLIEGDLVPGTYPVTSPVADFVLQSSGDRLLPETIRFDPATINDLLSELSQEIKVDGQALDFILQNNRIIGSLNGSAIVVIELSANQNSNQYNVDGHLKITLNGPIDHNQTNNTGLVHLAGDQITIKAGVQIIDADGDSLANPAQVTISVLDGAPPQLIHVDDISLVEPVTASATSSSAHFLIDIGSDSIKTLSFNYTNGENSGLFSDGHPVLLEMNNGVLHGYYIENNIKVAVFDATLTNQGNQALVDFELYKPVDHTQAGQDTVTLPVNIIAIDTDGDSATVTVPVHITDSVANPQPVTASVIEGDTVLGNLSSSYQLNVEGGRLYSFTVNGTTYTYDASHSSYSVTTDKGLLTINQDGSWSLQTVDGLDHDFIQQLPLNYTVIDGDGDFASNSLVITITDGNPSSGGQAISTSLVEGDLAPLTYPVTAISPSLIVLNNGSDPFDLGTFAIQNPAALAAELQADLRFFNTVSGQTESLVATVNNDSIVLRSGSGEMVLEIKLVTTLQANQDLSLTQIITLYQPLSHLASNNSGVVTLINDQIRINYQVQIADIDGDLLVNPVNLSATVTDGVNPVINDAVTIVQDGSSSSSGVMDINIGSDPIASIRFDINQPALANLTSNGYSTTTTISDHSIKVFDHNQQLLAEISLNDNGSYSVTLNGPLDQGLNNILNLPLNVTARDKDGDSDSAVLNVSINDGANPQGGQTVSLAVTEGSLSIANGYPVSDVKSFTVAAGIDRLLPQSIQIDSTVINSILSELGSELKSGGQTISFTYDNNTHTITGKIGSNTILTLTVNATQSSNGKDVDVSTTFTQYKPLDHLQTGNNTGYVHINGNTISINTPVQISDSDGDKLAAPVNLITTITDGVLPIINPIGAITVKESDINSSTGNHAGSTAASTGETANGVITVQTGSDTVASYSIDVQAFNSGVDGQWKSGGVPIVLSYDAVNDIYRGTANGVSKFTLKMNASGTYTFTLLGAIDHPVEAVSSKNNLDIIFSVIAKDADGDSSAVAKLPVTVQDDLPDAVNTSFAAITEGATTSTVDLLPTAREGADTGKIVSVWDGNTQYTITGTGDNQITLHNDANGQVIGVLHVFADGRVFFVSSANIDHDGVNLVKNVRFDVRDFDGDTDNANITLTINDKAATIAIAAASGVEDVGRDSNEVLVNPQGAIPINMAIDIGDFDNGESIGKVLIQVPATSYGDFYYNGVLLSTVVEGGVTYFVIPPQAFNSSDQIHYSLNGVTFVPRADFSSYTANLNFTVKATINYEVNGNTLSKAAITGSLTIDVKGIADVPVWDMAQTNQHYVGQEDAANIALQIKAALQDTDGSESIDYYLVKITSGNAVLIGTGLTPDANGYYKVSPANIGSLQINPANDYSGMVKVEAIAVSKENANFLSGFQYAQSQPIELTIDVKPVADNILLNINKPYVVSNEDAPINLGSFINLSKLADNIDLSENTFLRISNLPDGAYFSINGATLNVAGLGAGLHNLSLTYTDNQGQSHTIQYQYYKDAVDSSKNYYQFNNTDFPDVRLHPVPESNVDFSIKVQAVVIDQATLSTGVETDTQITSAQDILINLKGVSDVPVFDVTNTGWSAINNGVETTIAEDGQARLDFKLLSGEKALAPTDTSETITMVISNLPAGAQLLDSNGNTVTMTYVGLDANGQPKYEINLTTLSDLIVIPPPNSTADMTLNAHIVVTENDGNYISIDKQIVIHVTPVIDAGDYARNSAGIEDGMTTVNWRPPAFSDSQEFISGLRIENIPSGAQLFINGVAITTIGDTSVTLTSSQLNGLLQGQSLQIRAAEDSDADINLRAITSVSQQDADGNPTVSKDIVGNLHIDLQAVVEPDAALNILAPDNSGVLTSINALNGTTVNLSTNASSQGHLSFQDLDPSSVETIEVVVITGLGNQFVVIGGIYDGVGNWIVPASALDNLQISSKFGYNGPINVTFHAQVRDLGDNNEQDISNPATRSTSITLNFTGGGGGPGDPPVEAGTITITPAVIHTVEDIPQNISSQLSSMLSLSNGTSDDVYALLIQGPLPSGFELSGSGVIYDFVNDRYVIQVNADSSGNLSVGEVILQTPVDYSGSLPFALNWAAANMASGDSNTGGSYVSAPVDVAPVVDVPANPAINDPNHTPAVSLQVVQTEGLNSDKQPVSDGSDVNLPNAAYEDGLVILRLNVASADVDNSEQIDSVRLKVDPAKGVFVDSNGAPLAVDANGYVTVSVNDLNHLQFKPLNDFSGNVSVTAVVSLVDQALDSQGLAVIDSASYTKILNFEVLPVNDPVHFGGQFNFSGNEDVAGGIPLSGMTVSTVDSDGSEKIVSLVIRGVPDDFLISSAQNMGNGDWKITVNAASFDLSSIKVIAPENFSGSLDLQVIAFTKEALAALPGSGGGQTIHLDINPVSDPVDIIGAGADSTASGMENGQININLNFQARDNVDSYNGSASNVQENAAESLLITVKGVPEGAEIQLPAGVNGTLENKLYDSSTGEWTWVFKVNSSNLGSIVFLPGDFNGNAELSIQAQTVDNQAAPGPVREVSVAVDITAVNDAPINIHPASFIASEDQGIVLNNIQISDIDAREANGNMTVTLSVAHGVLSLTGSLSGILVTGNMSNEVTLTGQIDAINQALNGNLHYQSNLNYNGQDTLVINTNDNGNSGGPALSAVSNVPIHIEPVNDAPVNITPLVPLQAGEDEILTINSLRVTDVDAGANPVTVTLAVDHGLLSLSGSVAGVTVSGELTNHLVLTGTVDDINNLLALGVQYQGLSNYFGPDALTMTSNDLGNTGGPSLTDTDIVDIVVAARADNPEMNILYHSVVAALAILIPLNIQAEVVNPAANELRVRLDGLGDAVPVDENGNPLGLMLAQGSWEISASHLQQLHLQNASEGEHSITVTAISDVGDNNPLESAPQTIELTVVNSALHDLENTQNDHSNTHLVGSELEDVLRGVFGDDMLDGKGGNDLLIAGDGNDILIGGKGNDTLTGGAGHDIFLWQANDHGVEGSPERDIITDFNPQEDKLDLSQLLQGENESNLTHYLHFAYDAQSDTTTLSISTQGHFDGTEATPVDVTAKTDQEIVINGDLVGPATTQADIINTLFTAQQIVVDAS